MNAIPNLTHNECYSQFILLATVAAELCRDSTYFCI